MRSWGLDDRSSCNRTQELSLWRRLGSWGLVFLCLVSEISFIWWNLFYAPWDVSRSYPFQLCDFLMFGAVFYLLSNNQRVYEYLYFWGPTAALLSLWRPVFSTEGSLFYYANFYLSHGLILMVPLWGTMILGARPRKKALGEVFLFSHLLIPVFYLINKALGANYMFIMELPSVGSIGKIFFPYTILCFQGGALVVFSFLAALGRSLPATKCSS